LPGNQDLNEMHERPEDVETGWSGTLVIFAAEEAARSGHGEIEPVHLLIGLCRLASVRSPDSDAEDEDFQRLNAEFEALGIPAQQFRRRLRALVPKGQCVDAADAIRRALMQQMKARHSAIGVLSGAACSAAGRTAIARAGQLAGQGKKIGARHLLRALLVGDMSSAAVSIAPADTPDGLPDRL
jgi:Clp amino terminal domain, pathogenicity island component